MPFFTYYLYIILFSAITVFTFYCPGPLFYLLGIIVSFLTIITFIGPWNLFFEILSNFHPHLFILSLICLIASFMAGYFRLAALFAVCAFLHGYAFKDFIDIPPNTPPVIQAGAVSPVRVMTLNMQGTQANGEEKETPGEKDQASSGTKQVNIAKLQEQIAKENPTVLALTELPEKASDFITTLKSEYPYMFYNEQNAPISVVLLSKWPIKETRIERFMNTEGKTQPISFPVLSAQICLPDNDQRCFSLIEIDTPNTIHQPEFRVQQKILRKATEFVLDSEQNPVIVMGRLNTTPWTSTFKTFVRNAHLQNAAIGFMWQTTWIHRSVLFGLHFDHILVNKDVIVRQWWVGDPIDSNHYPVFANLLLKWPVNSAAEDIKQPSPSP
jgi:endonuclease/exonuclease/phosphatase (EEP) superfamily protein YafD